MTDTPIPPWDGPEPKVLYEWCVPAGCGYDCRIVETAPGMVRFEQRPLDIETVVWEVVPVAMGAANELVHLWEEVQDWRESARKAASEPCIEEKHCACVGLLREDIRKLENRLYLECSMSAKAIERADRAEGRIDYLTDALRESHGLPPLPKDQADFRRAGQGDAAIDV